MSSKNSPFGRHLKSLATRLSLWRKPKKENEVREVEEVREGTEVEVEPVVIAKPKPKVIRSRPLPKQIVTPINEDKIQEEQLEIDEVKSARYSQSSILNSQFPEGKNLVGQSEVVFTLDGKKHSLMVRTDNMYLDAQKYLVTANGGALGGDVELDILEFKRAGNLLQLRVGAFGKDVTIELDDAKAVEAFDMLLRGKTYKSTATRGQMIEITRNNY